MSSSHDDPDRATGTLAPNGFLKTLAESERADLTVLGQHAGFSRDDIIVAQGSQQENLFVLIEGRAEVIRETTKGETALADLRSGEFFGEISILDSRPASATVRASNPCKIWKIGRREFDRFLERHPQAGHRLLIEIARTLGQRLRSANERIVPGHGEILDGWW